MMGSLRGEQSAHGQNNNYPKTSSVLLYSMLMDQQVTYACVRKRRPRPVTDLDIQVIFTDVVVDDRCWAGLGLTG